MPRLMSLIATCFSYSASARSAKKNRAHPAAADFANDPVAINRLAAARVEHSSAKRSLEKKRSGIYREKCRHGHESRAAIPPHDAAHRHRPQVPGEKLIVLRQEFRAPARIPPRPVSSAPEVTPLCRFPCRATPSPSAIAGQLFWERRPSLPLSLPRTGR